jgi:CubicO group peptidase (beta-lactamase class C family)
MVLPKAASARVARDSSTYDAIDAYIERQMRRLSIPGVSLAIVEGNRIVHLRGFGKARSGGAAPSPQTPFVLGSTTKSFTALAVMQLVEAGAIELDAPAQRYLPWFRVADPLASAEITVRHLVYQTSGLPGLPGMIVLADLDNSLAAAERQARALSTLKLAHPPGVAFEYSNLNYNLLGLIVEAASGEPYADYMQRHIFTPLGMRHTYTSQVLAKQNDLAVGHRYWFTVPVAAPNLPAPRGSLASGQLISSAADMARYLIAHLNQGRCGNTQILSSVGIDELHHGVAEYRTMGMTVGKYAMGWFASQIGQTRVIWHGGNVPDFSSYMALLPEQKRGVVLLVNADHYGLPPVLAEVGMGVAALLAGQRPAPIKLGLIPWAMRALLLIPLLQIAGVAASLRLLRRWRMNPALRPSRGRVWVQHILLPLFPNLLLAAAPLVLRASRLGRFMALFVPDASWIAQICGGFAGVWAFLRAGLFLRAQRTP